MNLHREGIAPKEKLGELVGNNAIDFFWHAAIKGPQACFHVPDRNSQLGANQGGRDGGVPFSPQMPTNRLGGSFASTREFRELVLHLGYRTFALHGDRTV
jgi:hypothetical protein